MRSNRVRRQPVADRSPDDAAQWHVDAANAGGRRLSRNQHQKPGAIMPSGLDRPHCTRMGHLQGAPVKIDDTVGTEFAAS